MVTIIRISLKKCGEYLTEEYVQSIDQHYGPGVKL